MKKILLLTILLGITNVAYAAPTARYDRTIIPETTGTYDLGTSLKTWLTGYFDNICLGGVCKSIWPTGGGGGADGNWVFFNGSGIRLATTTNQVQIGPSATSSYAKVEISSTTPGGDNLGLLITNSSVTAGTKASIWFAPTTAGGVARGSFIAGNQEGGNVIGTVFATGQGAAIDEKMRLTGVGLLGIGTTTPIGQLSVSSANKTTAVPLFVVASSSAAVGTSTYFLIDKSGKTGIGTTSPYLLLGVNDGVAATYYNADSYGATSTFKGNLMIGDSLFNGQLDITSLGTGVAQLQVSTSTNDFAKVVFANTNTGTAAMFCNIYNNGRSTRAGVSSSYYGGVCYAGNNYNTAGFDGIKPNGTAIFASDGDVSIGSASTNAASSSIHFFAGRGFAASNEDMTLLGGVANLGIGTTSPYARLSVVGQAVASHFTATTTSSSTLPNLITTNLRVTNGLYDSANSLGTNGYVLQTDGTKSTWVSTSSLNIAGGGSGSGTVNSGTTGQVPYYAGAGTTLTATSTLFIDTTSFVGLSTTSPKGLLDVTGSSNSTSATTFVGGRTLSLINTDTTNNNGNTLAFRTNDANGLLTTASSISGRYTSHSASAVSGQITFNTTNAGINAQRGVIDSNGYLGLGTTTPGGRVAIVGTTSDPYMIFDNTAGQIVSGESLHKIYFTESGEFSALNDRTSAVIETVATTDHAGNGNSTGLRFSTGFSGTPVERLHLRGDGVTAFASSTPWGQYAFNANGAGITGPILSVGSSTQTSFVILNNGYVGIGSTSPATKLTVHSTAASADGITVGNNNSGGRSTVTVMSNNATGYFNAYGSATSFGLGGNTAFGSNSGIIVFTNGNVSSGGTDSFSVRTGGYNTTQERLMVTSGGNIGIASSTPWRTLSVVGTVAFNGLTSSTAGNAVCILTTKDIVDAGNTTCVTSARDTKKNINEVTYKEAQEILMALNPVSFNYKESGDRRVGFVAEEVNKIDPRLVDLAKEDINYKAIDVKIKKGNPVSVEYGNITSLLTKFVQGFYSDFQSLVARVTGMDSRLTKAEKEIEELKAQLKELKNK